MRTSSELRFGGSVIRYDASLLDAMEPNLFDPDWLRTSGYWQGDTQGRNRAHLFRYSERDMVLRHFHRGGLIGRLNRDLYIRSGAANSRAFREFDLLSSMRSEGLPVPRPVAARYTPGGLLYRADLITLRIPDARPLQDILLQRRVTPRLWRGVGAAVRKLHDHKVFHSDLNCRNIMIDGHDGVWLIDFDKCARREAGSWMQGNLNRLRRSLKKTAASNPEFNWAESDWDDLDAGYAQRADRSSGNR